jgi:hypothetical protein
MGNRNAKKPIEAGYMPMQANAACTTPENLTDQKEAASTLRRRHTPDAVSTYINTVLIDDVITKRLNKWFLANSTADRPYEGKPVRRFTIKNFQIDETAPEQIKFTPYDYICNTDYTHEYSPGSTYFIFTGTAYQDEAGYIVPHGSDCSIITCFKYSMSPDTYTRFYGCISHGYFEGHGEMKNIKPLNHTFRGKYHRGLMSEGSYYDKQGHLLWLGDFSDGEPYNGYGTMMHNDKVAVDGLFKNHEMVVDTNYEIRLPKGTLRGVLKKRYVIKGRLTLERHAVDYIMGKFDISDHHKYICKGLIRYSDGTELSCKILYWPISDRIEIMKAAH